jgi:hypothetical protein
VRCVSTDIGHCPQNFVFIPHFFACNFKYCSVLNLENFSEVLVSLIHMAIKNNFFYG